jgi:hypothetical protein
LTRHALTTSWSTSWSSSSIPPFDGNDDDDDDVNVAWGTTTAVSLAFFEDMAYTFLDG